MIYGRYLTEGKWPGEHIVSEEEISRETATLVKTSVGYASGTVLGRQTVDYRRAPLNPDATDGTQIAESVLYDNVDPADGDISAVVNARATEVNGWCLTWPADITDTQKTTATRQLADRGIVVRN